MAESSPFMGEHETSRNFVNYNLPKIGMFFVVFVPFVAQKYVFASLIILCLDLYQCEHQLMIGISFDKFIIVQG